MLSEKRGYNPSADAPTAIVHLHADDHALGEPVVLLQLGRSHDDIAWLVAVAALLCGASGWRRSAAFVSEAL